MNRNLIEAWYDGAVEPVNPGGHGSYGVIIKRGKEVLMRESSYLGDGPQMSNNVAEYRGIIGALAWLLNNGYAQIPILVRGDNKMSILQMSGKWRVRKGLYVTWYTQAMLLRDQFRNLTFVWVPRSKNQEADELSKKILREKGVEFRIQPEEARAS